MCSATQEQKQDSISHKNKNNKNIEEGHRERPRKSNCTLLGCLVAWASHDWAVSVTFATPHTLTVVVHSLPGSCSLSSSHYYFPSSVHSASSSFCKETKTKTAYNNENDEEKEKKWKVWIRPKHQFKRLGKRIGFLGGWLVCWLVRSLAGWLVGWLVSGLVGCLVDRLRAWLVGCLVACASHEQAVRLSGRAASL